MIKKQFFDRIKLKTAENYAKESFSGGIRF